MLEFFLKAEPSSATSDQTVCGQGIAPPTADTTVPDATEPEPKLLINPKFTDANGIVSIDTDIAAEVDEVTVQYSVELSTPLKELMIERGYEPEEGDYLFLNGGTVKGVFDGSKYTAAWNRDFYFLDVFSRGIYDALYVFDQGDNARGVPCMYFPESSRQAIIVNKEIQWLEYLFFNETKFIELGGTYCVSPSCFFLPLL